MYIQVQIENFYGRLMKFHGMKLSRILCNDTKFCKSVLEFRKISRYEILSTTLQLSSLHNRYILLYTVLQ
jgi:hypothetical protein